MSEVISEALKNARKIVIKIGSNTLAKDDGTQNTEFMASFASQCKKLIDQGKQIVVVSSGAQVSGVSTLSEWARKKDVHFRQALCAIGQVELMTQWRKAFSEQGIHIGQLLLTKEDFENDHRSLNIRNTLFTLWSADLLILFSDVDGIFTDNPKTNKNAKIVEVVENIPELRKSIKIGEKNAFGTGGIETKIQAAEKTTVYGIPILLANGSHENILTNLENGTARGTLFKV